MITWIVCEIIAAIAEVFFIRETYQHRPSLVAESHLDPQARRFRAWLLLSIGGAIVLITGAIYIWKHYPGSI